MPIGFSLRPEDAERFEALLAEHRADPLGERREVRAHKRKRPPRAVTRAENLSIGYPNTGKRRSPS